MRRLCLATVMAALTIYIWGGVALTPAQAASYTATTSGGVTTVKDSAGWAATYTLGSRTVTVRGPKRTIAEPGVSATISSTTRVRLLPSAFTGTVDTTWLTARLKDTSPDLIAVGLQYVAQATPIVDGSGRQIAGDASYGPLQADGTRAEGSDFNDYLGLPWTYSGTTDQPETDQFRSLDCSGFTRMVFGYRGGFPLTLDPNGTGLPRRAAQMASSAPGAVIVADTGTQAPVSSAIRPGDLVFFDASTDDGTAIDHVGIFLGTDNSGRARFLSSRKTPDGPTMGDAGALSVVSGTGFYARAFRSVRRL